MDGRHDLRVESRFKNALLYNALHERFGSLYIAASVAGVNYGTMGALLCLRISPWYLERFGGGWKPIALRLAEALDRPPEDLFPASLYALNLPRVAVREYSSPEVLSLQEAAQQRLLPSAESIDRRLEIQGTLDEALKQLSPKEEKIIRLRFGLNGPEQTLAQVGQEFDVQAERIRQIEARAFRKLRHGESGRSLKGLLS